MKIVVVGGSGLIGSRLVAMLTRDGHDVVADGDVGRVEVPVAQAVQGA